MTRLLFWILLFALGWWLWRKAARPSAPEPREEQTVPMVRCAQCGVHVPRSNALQDESNWYCSRAHLEQDRADRGH